MTWRPSPVPGIYPPRESPEDEPKTVPRKNLYGFLSACLVSLNWKSAAGRVSVDANNLNTGGDTIRALVYCMFKRTSKDSWKQNGGRIKILQREHLCVGQLG